MRDFEFDIKANDRSSTGWDSAEGRARKFNSIISDTAKGLDLAGLAARAFAGAFTLTAAQGFATYVKSTLSTTADLVDMADKVGVSVEMLQRLRYGFEIAGVSAESTDASLAQWAKRIGDAATHGGKLADTLKANGISIKDSEGNLRSSVDLMRDYADIVANAGSDQERLALATEAFGKSGGAMVLALKDGSKGFDEWAQKIDEVGGVIEDQIARRLAEIDDDVNKIWSNWENRARLATGESIIAVDGFVKTVKASAIIMDEFWGALGRGGGVNDMFRRNGPDASPVPQGPGPTITTPKSGRLPALPLDVLRGQLIQQRIDDAFKVPTASPARETATKSVKEQESAYERVIQRLNDERAAIGLNETEQRIMSEQRRAGVDAASEQGKAIAAVIHHIDEEQKALDAAAEASEFLNDAFRDSMMSMLPQIQTGNDALDRFVNKLAEAAAEAAFFGNGPLAGLFGTSGGGLFGGLFDFKGGRAVGGGVDPWSEVIVGENGPERLRLGNVGGHVTPIDSSQSAGQVYVDARTTIQPSGNPQADADMRRWAAKRDAELPGRVVEIVQEARKRRIL